MTNHQRSPTAEDISSVRKAIYNDNNIASQST